MSKICKRCGHTLEDHERVRTLGVDEARGDRQPLNWRLVSLADCLSGGGFFEEDEASGAQSTQS